MIPIVQRISVNYNQRLNEAVYHQSAVLQDCFSSQSTSVNHRSCELTIDSKCRFYIQSHNSKIVTICKRNFVYFL
jgi:hypothetical protein